MSSVAIVYRKDKINKKGLAPVHLRIILGRKINYLSTGEMIPEKDWDFKNNKVRSSFPNSVRLNNYFLQKRAEVNSEVIDLNTYSKSVSIRNVKEKIYGKIPVGFFEFAEEICEKYLREDKIGTYDKCKSILNKLKAYLKDRQIYFQDIDVNFLFKYEKYLREFHNNCTNTVHKDLKFIRQVFLAAYRMGLIEHQQIPFLRYQLKKEKTQRLFLTEPELLSIENLELNEKPLMEMHRDMFVFSAYTGGLRVSDILQLTWKDFDGQNINFTIRKTHQQISIRLPQKAQLILNKYEKYKLTRNDFIFPMMKVPSENKDARAVDNAISKATSYINKNLKKIALLSGIEKPLSFHISRHTFATRALRKGISIDKVSKLMGHAAIKETQIYAKIVNEELDKAMEVFND